MEIEGHIIFENEIAVTNECLGKEFPIVIAGFEGLLFTPLIKDSYENKDWTLKPPLHGIGQYDNHFDWGSLIGWPNGNAIIRACKILFKNIDESLYEQVGNSIALELPKWRTLLIENISLMLKKDYRGSKRVSTIKTYGLGEFGLFRDLEQKERFIPEQHKVMKFTFDGDKTQGFGKEGIQEVLNDVSRGKTPLLPFYFLLDAERSIFDKSYRKSILDSATSVEVCFSFLINQHLPYNNEMNKYISSKHNSLRLKRELLKALKVDIPIKEQTFIKDLDAHRNRVIHAGHYPNEHEATRTYNIAKETLYTLLPKKYEI